jgi:hypothetical protein
VLRDTAAKEAPAILLKNSRLYIVKPPLEIPVYLCLLHGDNTIKEPKDKTCKIIYFMMGRMYDECK